MLSKSLKYYCMRKIIYLIVIVVVGIISFSSCSKVADIIENSNKFVVPTNFNDSLVKLPAALIAKDTNVYVLELVSTVEVVNIYGAWLPAYFEIVAAESELGYGSTTKNANGSYTFTFTEDGSGISFTYNNSSTNPYYSYQVDSSGKTWTYFTYSASPTGGTSTWYSSAGVLAATDNWTISNGTTTSTFITYDPDGQTESSSWHFVSNSNLSGTCTISAQVDNTGPLVEQYSYEWSATGTGSYAFYGTTTVTGNF